MAKYRVRAVDRRCEWASLEDIENGDGIETAYIVEDEDGEIIMDTTNRELAYSYLDRNDDLYADLALEQKEQM